MKLRIFVSNVFQHDNMSRANRLCSDRRCCSTRSYSDGAAAPSRAVTTCVTAHSGATTMSAAAAPMQRQSRCAALYRATTVSAAETYYADDRNDKRCCSRGLYSDTGGAALPRATATCTEPILNVTVRCMRFSLIYCDSANAQTKFLLEWVSR